MRIVVALLALLLSWNGAGAASVEDDVQRYVRIFNGDEDGHIEAARTLAWTGLSDPLVFDLVERRLLDAYESHRTDRREKGRISWYIHALGFSGLTKYVPTLNKVRAQRDFEAAVRDALRDLPRYQKWNPVIANRDGFDRQYSDDVNRVMNMLRSDDLLLKCLGAKRIDAGVRHADLFDLLAQQVQIDYALSRYREPAYEDCIAWMVKALGSSRKEKYQPVLQEVYNKSSSRTIQRHAEKALANLNRP